MKNYQKRSGFTLIEILVTLTIFSIVGLLFFAIFSRSLRGSNKAQIILAIKQNGQTILENMDKTVRGADNIVCIDSDNKTLVIFKDGLYIRYRFVDPDSPKNGYILQDNPVKLVVDEESGREETNLEFKNRVCGLDPIDPMDEAVVLTDTNTLSGVSVEDGLFTQDKLAGYKDVVIIRFKIAQGTAVMEDESSIEPVLFQTTVQLR